MKNKFKFTEHMFKFKYTFKTLTQGKTHKELKEKKFKHNGK